MDCAGKDDKPRLVDILKVGPFRQDIQPIYFRRPR